MTSPLQIPKIISYFFSTFNPHKRRVPICFTVLPRCVKPLKYHVIRAHLGSEGPAGSRRSPLLWYRKRPPGGVNKQGNTGSINTNMAPLTWSHQQGGSESAEQSWGWQVAEDWWDYRCWTCSKLLSHTQSIFYLTFVSIVPTCGGHACPTAPKTLGSFCL